MKGEFGFARGFDHYERLGVGLRYSDRVIERAFELLDGLGGRSHTFLFLHFLDPHSDRHGIDDNTLPYFAPAEFRPDPDAAVDDRRYCDAEGNCATRFLVAADQQGREVDEATVERIKRLYRAGVEYLDDDLASLFEGLRARGLWDDALIVVTSDHGEEFREHGRFLHVQPYVENLAVPLLMKLPGDALAGTRVAPVVQSIDIMPTILELVGERPAGVRGLALQGRSLVPLLHGQEPDGAPPALGSDRRNRQKYALRSGDHSFVYDFGSGSGELYDLRSDPGETTDVSAQEPEFSASMLAELRALRAANRRARDSLMPAGRTGDSVLSAEEQEQLQALGYAE
jgi:arylsulfatase A-like enzyme